MWAHLPTARTGAGCRPHSVGFTPRSSPVKAGLYSLTLWHGLRFHRQNFMRALSLLVFATVLLAAPAAHAGPKKKPAAAAKKAAPAPAAVPSSPGTSEAAPAGDGAAPAVRGPTRIDFDDRLIQGQTNKSGAVYLYDRKELKIRSMIKKRENFRDEIVGSLYDT